VYLLSNDGRVVTCFHFESAIICPEVDRVCDARHAAFVDLTGIRYCKPRGEERRGEENYHLSSFCSGNGELQVCIFLPVPEEERELGKESIVDFASRRDGLGTGISIETTLQAFSCAHEGFPCLEVIGTLELRWLYQQGMSAQ
jgi:hypothetical protein